MPNDAVVEAVAKALFDHALKVAREEVDALGVSITDARQFFLDLAKETDAALVVLAASYIDTHLTDAFKRNMPGLGGRAAEEIFENTGPLSTMSAKIRIAHALGWLTDATANDLHLLRKIRNILAHDPYKRAISDTEIADRVASLSSTEVSPLKALYEDSDIPNLSIRQIFHIRAALLSFRVSLEMLIAPIAARHRVPKGAVMGDFDEGPELRRSLAREQARFLIELVPSLKS